MSTTTQKEWCAIVSLAVKAHNAYGTQYETPEQYDIVMEWANKWLKEQAHNRELSKQWNKDNPERHKANNDRWYARHKERLKNDEDLRERKRAYQREYYKTVVKPRRKENK